MQITVKHKNIKAAIELDPGTRLDLTAWANDHEKPMYEAVEQALYYGVKKLLEIDREAKTETEI